MNERDIFVAALDRDTPAERAAYLDEACAGDPALRERVDALLRSHEAAGDFPGKLAPQRLADEFAARESDASRTAPSAPDGGEGLDFLAPSEKPGSLGRLGHYEVQAVVGRGGMGVVLKAFDEALHRVVAVKVMAPQLAASATARQRFTREARAAAAVAHDHVVTIHGVEEAGGLPYIVMQFVDGQSLQDRLDRSGPLPIREVLRIGTQAASGLAAAHAQGLVHRDVKPANILLENGVERVKLTDFGLARAVDDATLTQSGVVAGTPQYMAPEQANGEAVDHRADLFSLGSVLYALCTGRPPFRADGSMAVLKRVCEEAPRPVREINPEVPDWLAETIARLHAKDPGGRFQSAAEVAHVLGEHLAGLVRPAPPPSVAAARPARGVLTPAPGPARDTKVPHPPRRRWQLAAALPVLLAGGLLLGAVLSLVPYRVQVTLRGQLVPQVRRTVYAPAVGEVRSIDVRKGESVPEGGVLGLMYHDDIRTKIDTILSEAESARQAAERYEASAEEEGNRAEKVRLQVSAQQERAAERNRRSELDALVAHTGALRDRPGFFRILAPAFTPPEAALLGSREWTVLGRSGRGSDMRGLLGAVVQPSDPLLRLGAKGGAWEVELKVPQEDWVDLERAWEQVRRGSGTEEVEVDLVVASQPAELFKGKLARNPLDDEAWLEVNETEASGAGRLAFVRINGEDIPPKYRLPDCLLVAGTEVHARVRCPPESLGWALLSRAWK
jgi:serine/threonine protein kinase